MLLKSEKRIVLYLNNSEHISLIIVGTLTLENRNKDTELIMLYIYTICFYL